MKWFWTKVFLDESVFGCVFFFCNLDENVPNHLTKNHADETSSEDMLVEMQMCV